MTDLKICASCRYNEGICAPPSPGGPHDGVECSHPAIVARDGDGGGPEEQRTANVWRVEVVVKIEEPMCEHWEKAIGRCPVCEHEINHLDIRTLVKQYSLMRLGMGESYDEELGASYEIVDEDEESCVFTCPVCEREVAHDDWGAAKILRGGK